MKKLLILVVSIFLLTSCFSKQESPAVENDTTNTPVEEVDTQVVEDMNMEESSETGSDNTWSVEVDMEVTATASWEMSTEEEDQVMKEFEQEINELFKMVENEE